MIAYDDVDWDKFKVPDWGLGRGDMYHIHTETKQGYDVLFLACIEMDPQYGDADDAEQERVLTAIEDGTLVEFCALVTVSQLGQLLGEDTLGSCIYKGYEEFHTTYRDDYYMCMVGTAIASAQYRVDNLKGVIPWSGSNRSCTTVSPTSTES